MNGKLNVLIIEDSEDDTLLSLKEMRKGGYDPEYKRVDTADDMRRALSEREWTVIIADHRMPHFNSIEALALLKESGKEIPFIIVSGVIGEDAAVAVMKAGANDYVRKDNLNRLVPVIEREVANTAQRRKQRETEQTLRERHGLMVNILEVINRENITDTIINDILGKVQQGYGFDSVAIRLRAGEDYPHFATIGFKDDFISAERGLCARNEAGEIIMDKEGGVMLECLCGVVICGRTDPSMPFFTAHGSFWTNNSTELSTRMEDGKLGIVNPRNRCIKEGYESIALVPLRSGEETIGLLQFNDRRTGRFTPDLIEFFEQVGMTIGITLKRRMMEDAIRENELRYRIITNNMHDTVWLMDMNFNITFISPSVTRLRGYTLDELNRLPLEKHFVPVSLKRVTDIVAAELTPERLADKNREISMTVELEFFRKDGSTFLSENTLTLIRDEDGVPRSILGVGRDITERKRAEEHLTRQHAFTRGVIESFRDGFSVIDPAGVHVMVNDSLCAMTGFARDELIGVGPPHPYWPEEEIEAINGAFRKIRSGLFEDFELVFKKKDGRRFPVIVSPSAVRDDQGRVIRFFALIKDISGRKRKEQKLARSEVRYRSMVEDAPLLVCRILPDYTITFANQAFGRYYGVAPEDLLGTSFLDRVPAGNRENMKANFASCDSLNLVIRYECGAVLPDGRERWLRWINRAVLEGERLVEYQCLGEDITERKQMEEELQRQLKELTRWNNVMLDREGRVLELKKEVNGLLKETGRPARYGGS